MCQGAYPVIPLVGVLNVNPTSFQLDGIEQGEYSTNEFPSDFEISARDVTLVFLCVDKTCLTLSSFPLLWSTMASDIFLKLVTFSVDRCQHMEENFC